MSRDPDEMKLFKVYETALVMWSRGFNTDDIARFLNEPEPIVCRWIWHWREIGRQNKEST